MSYRRDDIREMVRDFLYEGTANLFTDNMVNRAIDHTLRELPRRGVYNEEIQTTTQIANQIDYDLDDNVVKVEKVEINTGTNTYSDWQELRGWDQYKGALYLRFRPSGGDIMRIHCQQKFALVTDDVTDYDFSEDIAELVAVGATLRCYQMIVGYFLDASNWDALAKPDGTDMAKVSRWIQQFQTDYKQLIQIHRRIPRPRDINLID